MRRVGVEQDYTRSNEAGCSFWNPPMFFFRPGGLGRWTHVGRQALEESTGGNPSKPFSAF